MVKVQTFRTFKTKSEARKWGIKNTQEKDSYGGGKLFTYRVEALYTPKGKKRISLGKSGDKYVTWIL